MRRRAVLAFACCAFLRVVTACSDGDNVEASDPARTGPPGTYVAVGGSEAVGVGANRPAIEAWPQVLYRTAVDRNTVFVNLGVEGSTVAEALADQLPLALELRPTFVTVVLNANDLEAGVPVTTYEQQLAELVRGLRQDGRARVLVANTPPLEKLPVYETSDDLAFPAPEDVEALVAAYNEAIERVADTEGAELVDLHAAGVAAAEDGSFTSLVAADGFHPSTAGHEAIAEAFAAVL